MRNKFMLEKTVQLLQAKAHNKNGKNKPKSAIRFLTWIKERQAVFLANAAGDLETLVKNRNYILIAHPLQHHPKPHSVFTLTVSSECFLHDRYCPVHPLLSTWCILPIRWVLVNPPHQTADFFVQEACLLSWYLPHKICTGVRCVMANTVERNQRSDR